MIRLDNVSKQAGHQILFIEASAALNKGEKIGLVGPNGAGKTTLFRMIAGEELPDEGQVSTDRGITIGYFNQDVGEMSGRSAVAEVMNGAGPVSEVAAELRELEAAMADPDKADQMDEIIARYGEVQHAFEELDGYALDGRAREALSGLGFSQEMMDGDVGKLSGGWKMRVALARILLMRPDVMLLDEPSNHLDLESLIWLEKFLHDYEGTLLMTSHDREFINRVISKVIEIDSGSLTTYSGDYEFYEQQRAQNEKQQQAQFERQQAMLAKEIKFIERFKARASHAAQVQSRVKKLDKIERVEPPRRRQTVAFDFPPAPRSGEDVVALKNVYKGYGSKRIYDGLDFMIRRRERWCVMGVNGAGKSTLLKSIAGLVPAASGSIDYRGSDIAHLPAPDIARRGVGYVPQGRGLFAGMTVRENLALGRLARKTDGSDGVVWDEAQILSYFPRLKERMNVAADYLSGGEQQMVAVARAMSGNVRLLLLDEPFEGLAPAVTLELFKMFDQLRRHMSIVIVEHNLDLVLALADRVFALERGAVFHQGPAAPLLNDLGYRKQILWL